jgi:hypothetical protein
MIPLMGQLGVSSGQARTRGCSAARRALAWRWDQPPGSNSRASAAPAPTRANGGSLARPWRGVAVAAAPRWRGPRSWRRTCDRQRHRDPRPVFHPLGLRPSRATPTERMRDQGGTVMTDYLAYLTASGRSATWSPRRCRAPRPAPTRRPCPDAASAAAPPSCWSAPHGGGNPTPPPPPGRERRRRGG